MWSLFASCDGDLMEGEPKDLFDRAAFDVPEAQSASMMGNPSYKVEGKLFMSLIGEEAIFKLQGEIHTEALALDGAHLFNPKKNGTPMKEWVQVPFDHAGQWPRFAVAASSYVRSLL
ncbi:MAG: hypothetical protein AAFO61_08895 [Pseudomonadota bacterium]